MPPQTTSATATPNRSPIGPLFKDGVMLPLPGLAGCAQLDDRDALEYLGRVLHKHTSKLAATIAHLPEAEDRIELGHALALAEQIAAASGLATDLERGPRTPILDFAAGLGEPITEPRAPRAMRPAKRTAARR